MKVNAVGERWRAVEMGLVALVMGVAAAASAHAAGDSKQGATATNRQTTSAQGAKEVAGKHRIAVGVSVKCSDSSLKAKIESYITRELRSIPDVDAALREANGTGIEISVTALVTKNNNDAENGYALSMLVTRGFDSDLDIMQRLLLMEGSKLRSLAKGMQDLHPVRVWSNSLYVGSGDNLREQITAAIAELDTAGLEVERKSVRAQDDAGTTSTPQGAGKR
jgi:hypothetical protein